MELEKPLKRSRDFCFGEPKIIAFHAVKGGVGKTTCVGNIGAALAGEIEAAGTPS